MHQRVPARRVRIGAAVAAVAAAALTLAGCSASGGGGSTADPGEQITLSYAIWDQNQEPAMREIADAFTAENPGVAIEIQLTAFKDYWTKLQTAVSGGSGPDVFWMNGPNFQLYASNGVLAPLGDQGIDTANYPQGLVDLYTYDGTLYGAPKDFDTIGVWYNKELFDAAGVAYPSDDWTWDEFRATAEAITNPADGVYGFVAAQSSQTGYYNTIAQAGGYVISPDGTTSGFGSPAALEGVTFLTDFIASGDSPTAQQMTDTSATDQFSSGKIGMMFNGSWAAVGFAANADIADKVDVASLPTGPTGNQSVVHGLANVANAASAHVEVAQKFAAYASNEQSSKLQADTGSVIPAFNGTQQAWVDAMSQYHVQIYIDALDTAVPYPVSKNTSAWTKLESEILAQVWAGNVTPAQGLADLATQMQAALDEE